VCLKGTRPKFVSDLLPASSEVYGVGSNSKAWLHSIFQGRDLGFDMLGKLMIGGKLPIDDPLLAGLPAPFLKFYNEAPIGTPYSTFYIYSGLGQLYIVGDSVDHQLQKYFMVFDMNTNFLAVDAHLIPNAEGVYDLGDPFGEHVGYGNFNWRDLKLTRYAFTGKIDFLPEASETYRGVMVRVQGGADVADKLYCCMKKADDTYAWIQIASG